MMRAGEQAGGQVDFACSSALYRTNDAGNCVPEEGIVGELKSELFVALGERVAGVAILLAGQRRRQCVGDLLRLQPGRNRGLDLLIPTQALRGEQVLVERADQDEHLVSSLLEELDHATERLPLQRCSQVDPGI